MIEFHHAAPFRFVLASPRAARIARAKRRRRGKLRETFPQPTLAALRGRGYVQGMALRMPFLDRSPRVAVVRLTGAIGMGGRFGAGLNDAAIAPVLERAFRAGKPKAVALIINSPGGSPVQSSLIGARIRRLAEETKIPVHAFVEDAAASGGYWLACAADHIWVDDSSIVGSIGVVSSGFGLEGLITRNGIERRVHTAGQSKSQMDPFKPESPEDVARLREILEDIHAAFMSHVKTRRGPRLTQDRDLFQGEFWAGRRAVDLGLADGVAHLVPKMKSLFGDKVRFVRHGQKRGFLSRFGFGAASHQMLGAALDLAEERALWARIGL